MENLEPWRGQEAFDAEALLEKGEGEKTKQIEQLNVYVLLTLKHENLFLVLLCQFCSFLRRKRLKSFKTNLNK